MSQSPARKGNVISEVQMTGKQVASFVKHQIDELKKELVAEMHSVMKKPDRYTDRFLLWVADKRASWLIWPILVGALALAFGAGRL